MIIPKDVAELTKLAPGDVLQVTASEDGKFHTERADQIGGGK
jgi:bifunctional DNA-binding transcriptional regulator/antitoxin component of YhaV-PrlF toxin-antitoxin module